jgi:flagellar biosynthetic protein FliR
MDTHLFQVWGFVLTALFPFVRITSFFLTAPFFGQGLLPPRYLLALAMVMAGLLASSLGIRLSFEPFSALGLWALAWEIAIGVTLGLCMRLVLEVFLVAAEVIGLQMGLGFAQLVDPVYGGQTPLLGQLYQYFVIMALLTMGGHLALIELLAESLRGMPPGSVPAWNGVGRIMAFAGVLFKTALHVALPLVVGLALANLAFGVMSRAAPQLNLFSIGFPMVMTLGFVLIWLLFPLLAGQARNIFGDTLHVAASFWGP